MKESIFNFIPCGETLPLNNIHAVSVSMPFLQDVIDYEEQTPQILEKIKSAYPRFVMHPYLKLLSIYIKEKYKINDAYEVVLLSSQKAVEVVSNKYFIHNKIDINEPFGVILVQNGTTQIKKVLKFIQHVGYNLSSRLAEDYLFEVGILKQKHQEELEDKTLAKEILISNLAIAYNQPTKNICLTPSGMNAVYCALRGLKTIQNKNGKNKLIQLGWLYLDTMNIVEHYFEENKIFYDINDLDLLEDYLKIHGNTISAIVTEIPTNPLLQTVDLPRLKNLCLKYNIVLVIDATFATPFNLDLKPYADIYVESLTKFACGNADVLMGAIILNENSKISMISQEFFKQYFKNVGTNLDNPFLVINTELADYTIFNTPVPDNQKVTLQLKVEVLYKNNVILAKTYNSEVKDFIIVGWDLTPTSNTFEKLHKGLLNIYETEFKKDLIEALKNKI